MWLWLRARCRDRSRGMEWGMQCSPSPFTSRSPQPAASSQQPAASSQQPAANTCYGHILIVSIRRRTVGRFGSLPTESRLNQILLDRSLVTYEAAAERDNEPYSVHAYSLTACSPPLHHHPPLPPARHSNGSVLLPPPSSRRRLSITSFAFSEERTLP
jgi:hypothetical protein